MRYVKIKPGVLSYGGFYGEVKLTGEEGWDYTIAFETSALSHEEGFLHVRFATEELEEVTKEEWETQQLLKK